MYKRVRVVLEGGDVFEGVLLPPTQFSDADVVIVKLRNGYNVGIKRSRIRELVELGDVPPPSFGAAEPPRQVGPGVWVLAAGGTILSRVDYVTGGVYPLCRRLTVLSCWGKWNRLWSSWRSPPSLAKTSPRPRGL